MSVSPREAVKRLRELRAERPGAAVNALAEFVWPCDSLRVFRELYPREFAACGRKAPALEWYPKASALDRSVYAFATLIERDHFPVVDQIQFEEEVRDIPIGYYLNTEWWQEEIDRYPSALKLACLLLGCHATGDEDELWADLGWLDGPPDPLAKPRDIAPDLLVEVVGRQRGPARYVIDALRAIEHSADNIWIDVSSEMGVEPIEWSAKNVRLLGEEWREAKAIWRRIDRLTAWLDKDPEAHSDVVVRLWNRLVRPNTDERSPECPFP